MTLNERNQTLEDATETSPLLRDPEASDQHEAPSEHVGPVTDEPTAPAKAVKMHHLLPAIGVGMFMVALEQLFTMTSYAKIGNDLNALNNTSWIATAYFLALTIFQPLYGRLSDIFGRKNCLLSAYTFFGLGCLGCGIARNILQLCIARGIAGIGGGGVSALVSILLSDVVPLRERGVYQGYMNMIWGAGTSLGAPLGGWLADQIGWRWSFIIQVPLCVLAWLLVYFLLDLNESSCERWLHKFRQIDILGALVLALAITSLLLGLDAGANVGWSHLLTVCSLLLALSAFIIFIYVETRVVKHPFAPSRIILNPSLLACYLTNFFGMAGQMAMFFFIPLYFQAVQGRTASESGALMVPATVAIIISSIFGGWIIKKTGKFYWPTLLSFGILLFSVLPLALSLWLVSTSGIVIAMVIAALGIGSGITTTLIGLLANSSQEDSAIAIGCSYLSRSLGSSIGISVTSAAQQHIIRATLIARFGDNGTAHEIIRKVRESLDFINELSPDAASKVRSAYQLGALTALIPTTIFLMAAFLSGLWIREKPLKR